MYAISQLQSPSKFEFSHLPVTTPLFRCGQILCPELLYYDDITIIENNRQVHVNVGF